MDPRPPVEPRPVDPEQAAAGAVGTAAWSIDVSERWLAATVLVKP